MIYDMIRYDMIYDIYMIYDMIYLLGLTPGGSSAIHIYTQTIHRTTQLTILAGRISGIRTQNGRSRLKFKVD